MVRAAAPPLRRVGTFRVGSRSKLTPRDAPHFASLPPLLGEVADAVSSAACLPRKELFEAWEVATRISTRSDLKTRSVPRRFTFTPKKTRP